MLYSVGGGLIGLLTVVAAVLAFNFVRAPYRQRDEARESVKRFEDAAKSKLFDVFSPSTFVGLPLNRLDDGTYRASVMGLGFGSPVIAHRGELTTVTRVTASPQIRFTRADEWETTTAIRVTPQQNPMAGPGTMDFKWDTTNPEQWVLTGLPLTMARDEVLQLPMMMLTIANGDEAGAHFERGETCSLILRLAIRTDKGSPPLSDQVITLGRSEMIEAADDPFAYTSVSRPVRTVSFKIASRSPGLPTKLNDE